MKKFLSVICLMMGLVSSSFAATSVNANPISPEVATVQEKSETPDLIIVVTDENGTIIEIIVIKKR